MSFLNRVVAAVVARRITIVVWVVLLLAAFGLVSYNRNTQARTEAALGSTNLTVQDAKVRSLIVSGKLLDSLSGTQDLNGDPKSDRNVESVTLRENAANAVNRLSAANRITDPQAMDTMFLLRKDADPGVKATATTGLATLGAKNDANLTAIVSRLSNGDPDMRSAAVDSLDKIGGDKVATQVDRLMKDQEAGDAAQSALAGLGDTAVPYLLGHLNDKDPDFRRKILEMLGQVGSPLAVPSLVKVAADPDPSTRRLALSSLANTVLNKFSALQNARITADTAAKDPKAKPDDVQKAKDAVVTAQKTFDQTRPAEPALVGTLGNPEDDSQARTQAALALGRIGGPDAVTALVKALGDYDALVRSAALQGVQSTGPEAVGALIVALAQGNVQTQAQAAQALGGIGSSASLPRLGALVGNSSTPAEVRLAAVRGLGQSGSPAVIGQLVAALADPDGNVASAASDALLTPALEPAAVPLLVASFTKPSPVPFNASQTLSRMGNLPVSALRAAAQSANPQTQTWAAITLGQTDSKDPAIVASLTPLTHSANPSVQYAATQAVDRLSGT